jgi:hypothetical protein
MALKEVKNLPLPAGKLKIRLSIRQNALFEDELLNSINSRVTILIFSRVVLFCARSSLARVCIHLCTNDL